MISLDFLLDIVATEAIQGSGVSEDHPDEANIAYNSRPEQYIQSETELPPIKIDLELIRAPDGSLYWVE